MNSIIDFMNSHVSVRQFTDRTISEEDEKLIITTAQRSPTSSNLQAYSIISVREPGMKTEFAGLSGNQGHIIECPLFLVFCADLYRLSRLSSRRGYPFHGEYAEIFIVATVDTALVAGRALMAAQGLGMGGVMVGSIRNNIAEVSSLLGLPEYVFPVMGMSLGWPKTPGKPKPRLPIGAVWFHEKYRAEQMAPSIEEYDRVVEQLGHLHGREIHPDQYPDFTGPYSWSEHSARRLADNSPSALRPHILKYLTSRGFLKK